jgi:hypothetical protein
MKGRLQLAHSGLVLVFCRKQSDDDDPTSRHGVSLCEGPLEEFVNILLAPGQFGRAVQADDPEGGEASEYDQASGVVTCGECGQRCTASQDLDNGSGSLAH